jgi:hypothetical protein
MYFRERMARRISWIAAALAAIAAIVTAIVFLPALFA